MTSDLPSSAQPGHESTDGVRRHYSTPQLMRLPTGDTALAPIGTGGDFGTYAS